MCAQGIWPSIDRDGLGKDNIDWHSCNHAINATIYDTVKFLKDIEVKQNNFDLKNDQ